jgi:histidyl-tRNA synthetase
MKIARGLDYYSGIVFEIEAPALGAEKQLCGGGEYQLVGQFGGAELPTSGFAIGFDRTLLALEHEHYTFPSQTLDIFITPVEEKQLPDAIHLAQTLRSNHFSVDMDLARRGMSKAIKYAHARKTRYLIIVGPDELKHNKVTIRNMDTGEQTQVKQKELITFFQQQ